MISICELSLDIYRCMATCKLSLLQEYWFCATKLLTMKKFHRNKSFLARKKCFVAKLFVGERKSYLSLFMMKNSSLKTGYGNQNIISLLKNLASKKMLAPKFLATKNIHFATNNFIAKSHI